MSWPLFKVNLKSTWILIVGIALFTLIYVTASIAMYDPTSAEKMEQMFEAMPQGFLKALGFDNLGSELTPYLSNYLYGFIMLMFPLIGSSVLAHLLVSKHTDSGSMAYLISTPNSRVKIILTQAIYLVLALIFIFIVSAGVAISMCASKWPGMLDVGLYLRLNTVTIMVTLTLSAISFLAACVFGDNKLSIMAGVGIPVLMLVAKMISEISDDLSALKNFTLFTLVDINRILSGDSSFVLTVCLVLFGVTIAIYGAAITIFNKKSLVI